MCGNKGSTNAVSGCFDRQLKLSKTNALGEIYMGEMRSYLNRLEMMFE